MLGILFWRSVFSSSSFFLFPFEDLGRDGEEEDKKNLFPALGEVSSGRKKELRGIRKKGRKP